MGQKIVPQPTASPGPETTACAPVQAASTAAYKEYSFVGSSASSSYIRCESAAKLVVLSRAWARWASAVCFLAGAAG